MARMALLGLAQAQHAGKARRHRLAPVQQRAVIAPGADHHRALLRQSRHDGFSITNSTGGASDHWRDSAHR
jgi:hypothetical protein